MAEPATAAAEVVTAEAAATTTEAATPTEVAAAGAVTGKALTAEPRVSLHVCSQVVRRNGGNELACKSCVQFRSGNRAML